MPNAFFRAKSLWDAGHLEDGLGVLNAYLDQELGAPAFVPTPRILYEGAFPRLELAVFSMLSDNRHLQATFGEVFVQIWKLYPHTIWIGVLLEHNFYDDDEYFDFENISAEASRERDFSIIATAIVDSAVRGIVGPDYEGPNNGRPILRIEDIQAVPDSNWGLLKNVLLSRLPNAYAACPPDFWARRAANEPDELLMWFLHDLFLEFGHPLDVIEARWKAIRRGQPAYADAAVIALEMVLNTQHDPDWFTDVVRIDAGVKEVDDGTAWLRSLSEALRQEDFSRLIGST
jgi:hypothetical protein